MLFEKYVVINFKQVYEFEIHDNYTLNITEITYELGLNSKSYFSKIFKEKFGIGPNEYKKLSKSNKIANS